MRFDTPLGTGHLSYCTNVHPGERWEDAFAALREHVPKVRDAFARRRGEAASASASASASAQTLPLPRALPRTPFGLGLRLSHESVVALEAPAALAAFRAWLDAERCYVFTINGFPYGAFHGEPVKSNVYRPDWTERARLDYTCDLATLATKLAPPDARMTISTLPGTFKPWAVDIDAVERAIARNLLAAVAHCVRLRRDTGVSVGIAIEPEPCCLLERADEVVDFFARRLFDDGTVARFAEELGLDVADAREALREHLGVCHDVCHSAVEFERPLEAIERYEAAGIAVMKLQLSSALRLERADDAAVAALADFDEPVYLHQVATRDGRGRVERYEDIGAALAGRAAPDTEWRVHFHVPVFLDALDRFGTTQAVLAELLDAQRVRGIARHLEIETYTWDVLPDALRDVPVAEAIARELDWTWRRLCP